MGCPETWVREDGCCGVVLHGGEAGHGGLNDGRGCGAWYVVERTGATVSGQSEPHLGFGFPYLCDGAKSVSGNGQTFGGSCHDAVVEADVCAREFDLIPGDFCVGKRVDVEVGWDVGCE